jgi:hypothetical protein
MRAAHRDRAAAATLPAQEREPSGRRGSARLLVLLLALSVVTLAGVYLWLYLRQPVSVPVGFDTPKYIWRANLVAEEGVDALPGSTPSWFRENADRPGYPVLAGLIRGSTGVTPFELAFVLPAAMAVLIGLGAGTFALRGLREADWAFPFYAVGVGASVNVALTAVGLADNLIVDALIVATAATAAVVAAGQGGGAAALLLLTAAALVHWPFALVFLLVLAAVGVALVPESFVRWRRGERAVQTPAARLGALVGVAGATMGAAMALAPALPELPRAGFGQFTRKLRALVPLYRLPFVGPLAVAGAAALAFPRDRARLRGLILAVVWAGTAVAAVALLALGVKTAAHRVLAFALGIPILAVAAVVGAVRVLERIRPALAPVGYLLAGAAVAVGAGLATDAWSTRDRSWMPIPQLIQARQAGEYLEAVDNQGPVIFLINPFAERPGSPVELAFRVLRAGLPGDQVASAHVYLGDPNELLAGRATLRPENRAYNKVSRRHFRDVEPLLDAHSIVLLLASFNEGRTPGEEEVGNEVAPGISVLQGPTPEGLTLDPPALPQPVSAQSLIANLALVLGLLWLSGLGWARSLLPLSWPERVALAPALGMAALVVGGLLVGRLGLGGVAPAGIPVTAGIIVLGWVPFLVARRRPSPQEGATG